MAKAKKAAAKKTAKPKSKSKLKSKPAAKKTVAKKPVAKTPAAKTPAAKTPVAKTPVAKTPVAKTPVATGAAESLGYVTAPSGKLAIFDIGLFGFLPREALEPALVIAEVPANRALPVIGRRVGSGRFAECWDHVAIVVGDGKRAASRKLGEAGVDFARLIAIDHVALDHWQHEDSLDGLADFVFWGRDAGELARAMNAPPAIEGNGWTDLPVAEAEAKADHAARLKAEHHLLLAMDLRPHSHHFHALAAARAAHVQAGTIEVGGATACLLFTSWGDGLFPIFVDVDAAKRPVQIRIQLATAASNAAMRAVNA